MKKAKPAEAPPSEGAPEWMVSYADMITILMAFFVVMYSMQGKTDGEKLEPTLSSFRRQFGRFNAAGAGKLIPKGSSRDKMATALPKKKAQPDEVTTVHGPQGDSPKVMMIRPGTQATNGGVVFFEEGSAELTAEGKKTLKLISLDLIGKPQKIEIRGHASSRPLAENSAYHDHWDLAFARCKSSMDQLVALGVEPNRIRLNTAGLNEPTHLIGDASLLTKNGRVEVFMLNEFPDTLRGTPHERRKVDSAPSENAAGGEGSKHPTHG